MATAARIGDTTSVGSPIIGPGTTNVLIEGRPASVLGDMYVNPTLSPPSSFPLIAGSTSVLIGGKPAQRVGDQGADGTTIVMGATKVIIG